MTREERLVLGGVMAWFAITAAWWLLALWPVDDSPAWLERTRYVCFGVNETGLPDTAGWIGLIAAPLGMLAILLVGWWRAISSLAGQVRRSPVIALVVVLLLTGLAGMAGGANWRIRQAHAVDFAATDAATLPAANYPRLNETAPPLELIAQTGESFSLEQLKGRPVLVTFAFAHCQTICPVIVHQTLEAQRLVRAEGIDAAVVIVTLDPWRDTPSRLPAMADSWRLPPGAAWVLSGAVETVETTLDAWRIPRQRDTNNGDVTHPSLVYIMDINGRIAFAGTGGAAHLAELVRRL